MRKLKNLLLGVASLAFIVGCSKNTSNNDIITIAATPVPHAEILEQIKPLLAKDGIDLQIKEFSDYVQPNLLVQQKQLDANYFQHIPYLTEFNKQHSTDLVELVGVHIEPIGIYINSNDKSKLAGFTATKDVTKFPTGLVIGVPNDATNEGRALALLQKNGLIKIKDGVTYPTKDDISSNPYNLQFKELDAAMLPRVLQSKDLDIAVINSNYALQANLNPLKDAIFIEDLNSPYVNIIAVRPDELNEPKMKKLADALHSPEIKQFILNKYQGAIVPAF